MVVINTSYTLDCYDLSTPIYYKFYFGEGGDYNIMDYPTGVTIYQYVEDSQYERYHKNLAIIMSSNCFEMRDDIDALFNLIKELFYTYTVSDLLLW